MFLGVQKGKIGLNWTLKKVEIEIADIIKGAL